MAVRTRQEDRRQQEAGPPEGWKDRRHSVERRQIAVREVSYREWELAFNEGRMLLCTAAQKQR